MKMLLKQQQRYKMKAIVAALMMMMKQMDKRISLKANQLFHNLKHLQVINHLIHQVLIQ
jgi:hypothetical protein